MPDRFRVVDEILNPGREWVDFDGFNSTYMLGKSFAHYPVITAEVSSVPCASKGCCTMLMSFRPNTTDFQVFQQVWGVQNREH